MKIWRVLLDNLHVALLSLLLLNSAPALALSNITVLADESVSLAVSKLARDYARQSGVAVATSFTGKGLQTERIDKGAEANILITTDIGWLQNLQNSGLVDVYSRIELARARLALIGREDIDIKINLKNHKQVAPLLQSMEFERAFVIANPEAIYNARFAKEALRNIGWLDPLEPYTLYIKERREIYEMVRRGGFAIMPYPESLTLSETRVIDLFPEDSHSPIVYYATVLASDNMDEARRFMIYLRSTTAQNIINNSGLMATAPLAQTPIRQ